MSESRDYKIPLYFESLNELESWFVKNRGLFSTISGKTPINNNSPIVAKPAAVADIQQFYKSLPAPNISNSGAKRKTFPLMQSEPPPLTEESASTGQKGGAKGSRPKLLLCHDMMGGYKEDVSYQHHLNYNARSRPSSVLEGNQGQGHPAAPAAANQGAPKSPGSNTLLSTNNGSGNNRHNNNKANSLLNPSLHALYQIFQLSFWSYVDTFVYFAHYRVSLPSPSWIRLAHLNGTLILGTIITEGDQGMFENAKLLQGTEKYTSILVKLAQLAGFDGWLVNIEAPTTRPNEADNFCDFLSILTRKMHEAIPHSQVIWYDSLSEHKTSEIKWQNKLCRENVCFFFSCDGIFTNYWWKAGDPAASSLIARDRKYDVFTGLDVWGRGTFAGGGWNSHEAVKEAVVKGNTSLALFAWAWLYENFHGEDVNNVLVERKEGTDFQRTLATSTGMMTRFRKRERIYFQGLNYFKEENSLAHYFSEKSLVIPKGTDFCTTFTLPYGRTFYLNGEEVCPDITVTNNSVFNCHWTLLWHQSILPTFDGWFFRGPIPNARPSSSPVEGFLISRRECPISCHVDCRRPAFYGGSCLSALVHPYLLKQFNANKINPQNEDKMIYCPLFKVKYSCTYKTMIVLTIKPTTLTGASHLYVTNESGKILKFPLPNIIQTSSRRASSLPEERTDPNNLLSTEDRSALNLTRMGDTIFGKPEKADEDYSAYYQEGMMVLEEYNAGLSGTYDAFGSGKGSERMSHVTYPFGAYPFKVNRTTNSFGFKCINLASGWTELIVQSEELKDFKEITLVGLCFDLERLEKQMSDDGNTFNSANSEVAILDVGKLALTDEPDVDDLPVLSIHSISLHVGDPGNGMEDYLSWRLDFGLEHYESFHIYANGRWIGCTAAPTLFPVINASNANGNGSNNQLNSNNTVNQANNGTNNNNANSAGSNYNINGNNNNANNNNNSNNINNVNNSLSLNNLSTNGEEEACVEFECRFYLNASRNHCNFPTKLGATSTEHFSTDSDDEATSQMLEEVLAGIALESTNQSHNMVGPNFSFVSADSLNPHNFNGGGGGSFGQPFSVNSTMFGEPSINSEFYNGPPGAHSAAINYGGGAGAGASNPTNDRKANNNNNNNDNNGN